MDLPAPAPARERRWALALVLALLGVAAAWSAVGLHDGDLQHFDEWFTYDRTRNLLRTGDWTTLTANHAPVNQKPPLQYWLGAPLLAAGMDAELALRLWSWLFALGTLALAAVLARQLAPQRPWAAPAAVALLASSTLFWDCARSALLDTGHSFFVLAPLCLALAARARPRLWAWVGVVAGLGSLQKSPAGLVAVLALLVFQAWGDPQHPCRLRRLWGLRSFRVGTLAAGVLLLGWPLLQAAQHGVEFLGPYFGKQMVRRFRPSLTFSDDEGPVLPWRWVPWLVEMAPVAVALCTAGLLAGRVAPRLRREQPLAAVSWLAIAILLLFSVAGGRIYDRYVLAPWPLLCAAGACALARLLPGPRALVALLGLCALGTALPALAQVHGHVRAYHLDQERAAAARFVALQQPGHTPVFMRPASGFEGTQRERGHAFPPGAFLVFTSLDRPAALLSGGRWTALAQEAARGGGGPPYVGLCLREQLEGAEPYLGPVEVLEGVGPYVIWRAPGPAGGPR